MIEKMSFINITGPKDYIDTVVETYLSKYEIHLENALAELKTVKDLQPFVESNPHKELYSEIQDLVKPIYTSAFQEQINNAYSISLDEAKIRFFSIRDDLKELKEQQKLLTDEYHATEKTHRQILPFKGLNANISDILKFTYIKFRFGKIAIDYYEKFQRYAMDNLNTFFLPAHSDKDYVWGVYFVPVDLADRIDAIYLSLHFERLYFPDGYVGSPEGIAQKLQNKLDYLEKELLRIDEEIALRLNQDINRLAAIYKRFENTAKHFDVRKMAACTREGHDLFFILCGWMPTKDAKAFESEIETDKDVYCIVESDHNNVFSNPPSKLKNPRIFKPFELFVEMYGIPDYNEMDPTIFVALTYAFIFGCMFGDVGQGLCLLFGGALIYKLKKNRLAAIISTAGLFSTFFGFMFGSFFGFENVIKARWLHPVTAMTRLPFIGNMNTVFVYAIAFGMFLILIVMLFNMINSIRSRDIERGLLDKSGLAGFVFYASLVAVIFLFMSGNALPAGIVLGVMFGLPLLIIALKEPITRKLTKEPAKEKTSVSMFLVQTFFELFEILLSYFSNTLSFVRIGAFALSHAAMMQVVLMLAGAEAGSPNWVVIVIGNIFVCLMEGLIVGIQVLRLEYYEFFSRFYSGTGRKFKSYSTITKNNL